MEEAMEPTREEESTTHPTAHRLDAVAAGDADEGVSKHLAVCEDCTRYVADLREQAATFRAANDAKAFVARAEKGALQRERTRGSSHLERIALVASPLLAAALVVLVVRLRSEEGGAPTHETPLTVPATESHFKGEFVVAVIRDRDGHQERITGPFRVRAGDRVRVEVSTDHEGSFAAGLLTDDGEWVALLAPAVLGAGTHFSEVAARFDASPTRATLLVGAPAAVERARATRDIAGTVAWRVTSEGAP
jgi:predicted anti-sigma-YlaC factor YlaD